MPSFPRFTAGTSPSGPPTARAQNIGALVRTSDIAKWQGISAIGQAIQATSGLAFEAYQNRIALDDEIEKGRITQKVKERFSLAKDEAARYDFTLNQPKVGDTDYYQTVENFDIGIRDGLTTDNIGRVKKDLTGIVNNIKSPKVRAEIDNWLNDSIGVLEDGIRHTYGVNQEDWSLSELSKLGEDAAKNGELEIAEYYANKMDEFNLLTPQAAETLRKNYKVIADTSITRLGAQAVMAEQDLQAAKEFVMGRDVDIDIQRDIISEINFQASQQQEQLEIAREADRDKLGKALEDATINYDMINKTRLKETEQESYRLKMYAEAKRKADGIPIATDRTVLRDLESLAYDVGKGAVTESEFKREIDNARYPEKGPPLINDNEFTAMASLAERKFESYQSGAMDERELHALGQLVTHPSELGFEEKMRQLTSQFAKDQERALRQLQFDNLDQYKKALRDWLKKPENKDANADEIYTEGRKLLKHYRKSPEQLRVEVSGIVPPTKEQLDKISKGIQDTISGLTTSAILKPKGNVLGISTTEKPANLVEFEERMASLPTVDARRRYYNKWYKDVRNK